MVLSFLQNLIIILQIIYRGRRYCNR